MIRKWKTGNITYYREDEGYDGSYLLNGVPVLWGDSCPIDMRNEAVTKALTKIADQKVNLGENLATFKQTLGLLTGKLQFALNYLKVMRNATELRKFLHMSYRDIMRKEGLLTASASRYLEYVYGIRPLMQDIYELFNILKQGLGEDMIIVGRGDSRRTQQMSSTKEITLTSSNIRWDLVQATAQAKCVLWARIDPSHRGLRALNQLGLLNPAGVAWDTVPYSFVVDWFVPIGPVLYALTAPAGLIFISGSLSFRNSESIEGTWRLGGVGDWKSDLQNVSTTVPISGEFYDRVIYASWPRPGFWASPNPFAGDRLLKALALTITGMQGQRRSMGRY
jgi:hypothetical protein